MLFRPIQITNVSRLLRVFTSAQRAFFLNFPVVNGPLHAFPDNLAAAQPFTVADIIRDPAVGPLTLFGSTRPALHRVDWLRGECLSHLLRLNFFLSFPSFSL